MKRKTLLDIFDMSPKMKQALREAIRCEAEKNARSQFNRLFKNK